MQSVAERHSNTDALDEVVAQTVAWHSNWQMDGQGHLYDERGMFIAPSLEGPLRRSCEHPSDSRLNAAWPLEWRGQGFLRRRTVPTQYVMGYGLDE